MALPVPILGELVGIGRDLIDHFFPDKIAQAKQRAEAEQVALESAIRAQEAIGNRLAASDSLQTDVNKIEAASDSLFKSGWRPAVGWLCVTAFSVQFVVRPLLPWAVGLFGTYVAPIPSLDMSELFTLLFGMLGLGAYRTYEKKAGVA